MKLKNCCYDKVKLLHSLSCITWFIEKHAQVDANNENNKEFLDLLKRLQNSIDPYITELHTLLCKEKK